MSSNNFFYGNDLDLSNKYYRDLKKIIKKINPNFNVENANLSTNEILNIINYTIS